MLDELRRDMARLAWRHGPRQRGKRRRPGSSQQPEARTVREPVVSLRQLVAIPFIRGLDTRTRSAAVALTAGSSPPVITRERTSVAGNNPSAVESPPARRPLNGSDT
jgi:hypothetical protein